MTLPRFIIFGCLMASAVLGYFVFVRMERLEQVKDELVLVKKVIKEIQQDAVELERLQALSRDDKFKEEETAEDFIRAIADQRVVQLGQVKLSNKKKPGKGVEDHIYTIQPVHKKEQKFHRDQIGNFLYRLEEQGSHVKVTSIVLKPHDKVRPGEFGNDEWTYDIELTSRTKDD
jgi:hypothetical protein